MPADIDTLSWPPDDPPHKLPDIRPDRPPELWRLHWEADPNKPTPANPGRWRFDAPLGEWPVTYVNASKFHVFAEVYGDNGDVAPDQLQRKISCAHLKRDLRLVDLGDARWLRALKIDSRICDTVDYRCTQRWAARLRSWLHEADGIRYPGRKAGRADNYCLWLDRCADALEWTPHGILGEQEYLVLVACEMFSLSPRLFLQTQAHRWP